MKHGRVRLVQAVALAFILNETIATLAYVWSLTGVDCDPYNDLLTWFALPVLAQVMRWLGSAVC